MSFEFFKPNDAPQEIAQHPEFNEEINKKITPYLESVQKDFEMMRLVIRKMKPDLKPEEEDAIIAEAAEKRMSEVNASLLNYYNQGIERVAGKIRENMDGLTNLLNKVAFEKEGRRELEIYKREEKANKQIGLVIIDGDNFKRVNDKFGHDEGDRILRELAQIIKKNIRPMDFAGRVGGEEFAILFTFLPDEKETNLRMIERLRKSVEEEIKKKDGSNFTISLGFADTNNREASEIDFSTIFKEADSALYYAKENGRNQSVIFDPEKIKLKEKK